MQRNLILLFIFISCNNNSTEQQDLLKIQKELNECQKLNDQLIKTPSQRLINAKKLFAEQDYVGSKAAYLDILEQFPGTPEAKEADTSIKQINELVQTQQTINEKKKTLGYKSLKEANTIKIGDVTLSIKNIAIVGQWTFDSYDGEYHYRNAERGDKYVVARISISADSKDPDLPPLSVYKMTDGKCTLLGTLEYRFVRWEDYATYLGNNSDYSNDFAHTKMISFSCGLEIAEANLASSAVFVVTRKINCFFRSTDRFENPPVSYLERDCKMQEILSPEDFNNDYVVIKIFNRDKL